MNFLQQSTLTGNPEAIKTGESQVIEHYRRKGIHGASKGDIKRLIEFGMVEPIIPDQVNCGNPTHTSPFQFIYEVLTGRTYDFILWANRAGSKTYLAGLISWILSSYQNRRETKILGGSEEQSEKAYRAMNSFWYITKLEDQYLAKDPMISKTFWNNGSEVSILTASQKSVRGPHPQCLLLDEIDEMDELIYEAAIQQPQTRYGIKATLGKLSTNHHTAGVMSQALERAEKNPFIKIYKWCIWECLESCRDYQCGTCELSKFCPGKHMKKAAGYYKIEDFIKKLYDISMFTLETEWFCNKVGTEDLIYGKEFNEDIHFIHRPFNPALPVYLSVDWGGANPFSLGAWQNHDDIGWIKIETIFQGNTANPWLIAEAKKRDWWGNIHSGVADPSRVDLKMEWANAGVEFVGANNDVEPGIEAMKNCLDPVLGNPKVHWNRDLNIDSLKEFYAYKQKKGKPVKENDHTKDEERYFIMWKVARKEPEVFAGFSARTVTDLMGRE